MLISGSVFCSCKKSKKQENDLSYMRGETVSTPKISWEVTPSKFLCTIFFPLHCLKAYFSTVLFCKVVSS